LPLVPSCSNPDTIEKIVKSLNVKLHPRDLKTKDHRTLLALIMSQWLPLSTTTFQTVVEIIPPPQIAQSIRVPKMLHPDTYIAGASSLAPTDKLETELYSCDPSPEAGVVVYVSKMFAVARKELPENQVKQVSAEDMREQARKERERRAEERRREIELDKSSLIGLESDGKVQPAAAGIPIPQKQEDGEEAAPKPTFVSVGQPTNPSAQPPSSSPEPVDDSSEALIGFARLYSGTLTLNTQLYCLLPKYNTALGPSHPANVKYISKVRLKALYMMMGRDLVAVDKVPAGNVFAIGGLEGKVWRNATLCALDGKDAIEEEDEDKLKAGLVNLAGVIMAVSSPSILSSHLLPTTLTGLAIFHHSDSSNRSSRSRAYQPLSVDLA
jgi:ribosome assembly protein 1